MAGGRFQHVTLRAVVVVALMLYTFSSAITSLVLSIQFQQHVANLRANRIGDPEKEFMDDCLKDFSGLDKDSQEFVNEHRACIDKLKAHDAFTWLPRLRLTVDDLICDPQYLCTKNDPGNCGDSGNPRREDWRPGNVTRCYNLIDAAKTEKDSRKREENYREIERQFTKADRWEGYENEVKIKYCVWKHAGSGVCTNRMRSDCAEDGSCCPQAQTFMTTGGDSAAAAAAGALGTPRQNQYVCQKSPVVGLYCQHLDYRDDSEKRKLCTKVTCPTFEWCADFTDIPGICLGPACKEFERMQMANLLGLVLVAAGLGFDLVDFVIFIRYPTKVVSKAATNLVAAGLKTMGYVLCTAGGSTEFMAMLYSQNCFSKEGQEMVQAGIDGLNAYLLATLLSVVGSVALAPFSVYWGGKLIGVPYTLLKT